MTGIDAVQARAIHLEHLVRSAMASGVACFTDKLREGKIQPTAPLTDAFGIYPAEFIALRQDLVEPLGLVPTVLDGDPDEIEAALDALPVGSIVVDDTDVCTYVKNGQSDKQPWAGTGMTKQKESRFLAHYCAPLTVLRSAGVDR